MAPDELEEGFSHHLLKIHDALGCCRFKAMLSCVVSRCVSVGAQTKR